MVTVSDLLDIIWDVTELEVNAYDNYRLQHRWIIGENIDESHHQWYERKKGELSIIDRKINHHGDKTNRGCLWETGWGANKKNVPSQILAAEVTHMLLIERLKIHPGVQPGKELCVSVKMDSLTVETLKSELAEIVRPLEGYEDEVDKVFEQMKNVKESNPDEQQV